MALRCCYVLLALKPSGKKTGFLAFISVIGRAGLTFGEMTAASYCANSAVNNTPPVLTNVAVTSPIIENGMATLSGNITDPDVGDVFSLTVNWGDGSAPQVFNYGAGTTSFSQTHQYLDDNPSGTPSPVPSTIAAATRQKLTTISGQISGHCWKKV